MTTRHTPLSSVLAALVAAGVVAGAGGAVGAVAETAAVSPRETAVAPEINPPGDIPDDQVFITYKSPDGFAMQVPEGWSRSDGAGDVSFADKYDQIDIAFAQAATAPTETSVKQNEVADLKTAGHAVEVTGIRATTLPAGDAVVVDYLSNSAVNPVTDRKIRLENRRIYYFKNGKAAVLTLSAPAGADNVDQWKMMAESFRWTS